MSSSCVLCTKNLISKVACNYSCQINVVISHCQWWLVTKYIYPSTLLNFKVRLFYLNIYFFCSYALQYILRQILNF